jgi:uncharacterized membrane protein
MLKRMTAILDPVFIALFKILVIIPFLACYTALSSNGPSQLRPLGAKELTMASVRGAMAVGLGDVTYFIGLSLARANIVAPLSALTPMFVTLIAMFSSRKRPDIRIMFGTSLVVVGVVLLTY